MITSPKRKISKWRLAMIRIYADYQASKQWRINRDKCLKANNYKCKYCSERATIAHHTSYDRWALGDDELNDLVPVCRRHHAKLQNEVFTPFFAQREPRYWYFTRKEWRKFICKIPVIK